MNSKHFASKRIKQIFTGIIVIVIMAAFIVGCGAEHDQERIPDEIPAEQTWAEQYMDVLHKAVDYINKKTSNFEPEVALVLGTGLGGFVDAIEDKVEISYDEIPGLPVSTAPSHEGRFVLGTVKGVKVVCMQGRVHCYEGYEPSETVMPIRVMGLLGAKKIILTNNAGGITSNINAGDIMLIRDHISAYIKSPLIGENLDELGDRFVDMTEVYDKDMRQTVKKAAGELGIEIKEGVYLQDYGPQYETPTEIDMYERDGADAIGMSTVCEAIAARHMGMKVCGISFISCKAAGRSDGEITDEEIQENTEKGFKTFEELIKAIIEEI